MTQAAGAQVEALKAAMAGAVVTPDELDYEQARKVWNADIDYRPEVIAQCTTAQDVAEAILFGREQGLELAVRCGAHSMPGYFSVDGGLVIDLGRMNQVTVDPQAKRARVQGGACSATSMLPPRDTRLQFLPD
jgi:FAD/FMN-containing dehydrogenase